MRTEQNKNERDFQFLYNAAGRLMKAAEDDRTSLSALIEKQKNAYVQSRLMLNQLSEHSVKAIESSAEMTAIKAAELLQIKFEQANAAAKAAEEHYREAASKLRKKMWFFALSLQTCLFGIFLLIVYNIIPSYQDIQSLYKEKQMLEQTILDLEKRGGLMELSKCDGRLCIRMVKQINEWNDKHNKEIIYGIPWGY